MSDCFLALSAHAPGPWGSMVRGVVVSMAALCMSRQRPDATIDGMSDSRVTIQSADFDLGAEVADLELKH